MFATTLDFSSVQFNSVAQSCPTLCDPMNCSTPGLPVHHQFPEFTQTHVHRVSDAIQPSHSLDLLRHKWCVIQSDWAFSMYFCAMSEKVLRVFLICLNLQFYFVISWVKYCWRLCSLCWKSVGIFCQIDIWCFKIK